MTRRPRRPRGCSCSWVRQLSPQRAVAARGAANQVDAPKNKNDRVIYDDEDLAETLWAVVKAYFPETVKNRTVRGLNERFRFYRYQPGQKFARHRDGSFERNPDETSWITLMVYLNEGYEGGRTNFYLAGEPAPRKRIKRMPPTGPRTGRSQRQVAHNHTSAGDQADFAAAANCACLRCCEFVR